MRVAVVALGKIGLPLAVQYAGMGHCVIGCDVNRAVVASIADGRPPFPGEFELAPRLREALVSGRLSVTSDTASAVSAAEVVVVVVPLVVDVRGDADFGPLDAATEDIGAAVAPGTLVIYETTLPVGTTRNRFAKALVESSGLELGSELLVCHSPERVSSGRIFADLRKYPKLIGGVDRQSARAAVEFYEEALTFDDRPDLSRPNGVWDLGSSEAAELAKLAETTYRDVNIAYANELAMYADRVGLDVYEVIAASNSQPFSHIHQPGIAVGGHCIPVYPRFYLAGDPAARLPRIAREINEGMPAYSVARLNDLLGSLAGRRVAVLGAAYRGGVKETAFSGVFAVVRELGAFGAVAVVHDPLYSDEELVAYGFQPYHFGEPCDAAIIQADHHEYSDLTTADLPGARAVFDGRRVLPGQFGDAAQVVVSAIGCSIGEGK